MHVGRKWLVKTVKVGHHNRWTAFEDNDKMGKSCHISLYYALMAIWKKKKYDTHTWRHFIIIYISDDETFIIMYNWKRVVYRLFVGARYLDVSYIKHHRVVSYISIYPSYATSYIYHTPDMVFIHYLAKKKTPFSFNSPMLYGVSISFFYSSFLYGPNIPSVVNIGN